MIEYKLVNAIANVESGGSSGSDGGSGGGTTNDLKLAVQFTLFSNDTNTQEGVDSLEEDGTYLFKLATATVGLETIAKGTIKFYGSKNTLQKPKTEFEYIPSQSGSGNFKLTCKTSALLSELTFELLSLTRIEKMHYDSQAKSDEPTRMYFYNISDQEMSSAVGIIELAKLSLNIIFFK